jgi:thiopeptide-type bacteriocin biosynthesis protein
VLAPARAAGDVAAVETAEYFRETARYGEDAMVAVEHVFESDSRLVCELLAVDETADAMELLVLSFDSLASGCGLELARRRALAARCRDAYGVSRDAYGVSRDAYGVSRNAYGVSLDERALAAEYRARQRRLQTLLADPPVAFAAHARRVADATAAVEPARREALLPALLHLASVRLLGPVRASELAGIYFWERALEGLLQRNKIRPG